MILAFTTAFDAFSVAVGSSVASGDTLKGEPLAVSHFTRTDGVDLLAPQVERMISKDISRIAVAVGPGSFTGVRIGIALAVGLAMARGIKAVGVSTLYAQALKKQATLRKQAGLEQAPSQDISQEVVLPAGNGNYYVQRFRLSLDKLPQPLGEPALLVRDAMDSRRESEVARKVASQRLFSAVEVLRLAANGVTAPLEPLYVENKPKGGKSS